MEQQVLFPKLVVAILKWEQLEKHEKISEIVTTLPSISYLETIWRHMKHSATFMYDKNVLFYCLAKLIRFRFQYFPNEETNIDLIETILLPMFMEIRLPPKVKTILLESLAMYSNYELFSYLEISSTVLQHLIQEGIIKSENTCCNYIAEFLTLLCDKMDYFKETMNSDDIASSLLTFSFVSKPSIDTFGAIKILLQSKEIKDRRLILRILFRLCYFEPRFLDYFLEIFERVLYFEHMPLRIDCLTHLWELVFIHSAQANELFLDTNYYQTNLIESLMQFLYGPQVELIHSTIIGMQRILFYDSLPDYTEIMISYLTHMYCSSSLTVNSKPKKKEEQNHNTAIIEYGKEQQLLLSLILEFFQLYVGVNKELHQKEIANTILHVVIDQFQKGILPKEKEDNTIPSDEFLLFQNQILFLFSLLQSNQFETMIVENIMANLEALQQQQEETTTILPSLCTVKFWLSLS